MTAEELADRFDLSITAARIRLEEIGKIKRREKGHARPLPQSVLKYLQDGSKKGFPVTSINQIKR